MRTEMNTFGIYITKRLVRAVDNGASLDELLEIAGSTSVKAEADEIEDELLKLAESTSVEAEEDEKENEKEEAGKQQNEEDSVSEEEIQKLLAELREEYEKLVRKQEQEAVESVLNDLRPDPQRCGGRSEKTGTNQEGSGM